MEHKHPAASAAVLAAVGMMIGMLNGCAFFSENHDFEVVGTEATTTTTTVTTEATTEETTEVPREAVPTVPAIVTVAPKDGAQVQAEYLSQDGFPTGCESASAVMLLRFWGVDISIDTFVDRYLEKGEIKWGAGGMIAPHPKDKFIGDPRSACAYGCYAPVIVKALKKATDLPVINETGSSLGYLCTRYLDKGMPVMVWATIGMDVVGDGSVWTVEGTGEKFTWKAGEHCMLLVGYDDNKYYFNDPYENHGRVAYSRRVVEARYQSLGRQAVAIRPQKISE